MSAALLAAEAPAKFLGWPFIAGAGLLLVLWLLYGVLSGKWNPWRLVIGADGRASTSKLQWFLWLVVIVFAYTAIWVARAITPNLGADAISEVPVNVLTVLGLSSLTMAAAKGVTSAYVNDGRIDKTPQDAAAAPKGASPLVKDNDGDPDLSKMQLLAFTLIALAVYLVTVFGRVLAIQMLDAKPVHPADIGLPDIDGSLMVLMGLSQAGYLGKKLTTSDTPRLTGTDKAMGSPGTVITLSGLSFGASIEGSQLLFDGAPVGTTAWEDTRITFAIPAKHPTQGAWTADGQLVQLSVVASGQASTNQIPLTVKGA